MRISGRAAPRFLRRAQHKPVHFPTTKVPRGGCLRAQGPLGTRRNTAPGSCLLTVHSGWKLVSVHAGGSLLVSPEGELPDGSGGSHSRPRRMDPEEGCLQPRGEALLKGAYKHPGTHGPRAETASRGCPLSLSLPSRSLLSIKVSKSYFKSPEAFVVSDSHISLPQGFEVLTFPSHLKRTLTHKSKHPVCFSTCPLR